MSQKLENQLNLALEMTEELREQTGDLSVGYDRQEKTWELIVKYNGAADQLRDALGPRALVEPLIAGFGIITVPESLVDALATNPQIEYVEKPKNFYYVQEGPAARACIAGVIARDPFLSGKGILLAIIDSGIAYWRKEFRDSFGRTRIRFFWDQTLKSGDYEDLPGPPEGFFEGAEFDAASIDHALNAETEAERFERLPTIDVTGHGTAVAGIAAASRIGEYQGVAANTDLMIVKLGGGGGALAGYSKTTEIMRAVTYCVRKAMDLGKPLVINLSFGNTYGAHDGSSLLERFLDNASEIGRTVICVGSGNEGNSSGHVRGNVLTRRTVDLTIADPEPSLSIQLWKDYCDQFRVTLRSPGGSAVNLLPERLDGSGGGYMLRLDNTRILVYFGEPTPYSVSQEIYLELLPAQEGAYLPAGIWQLRLEPVRIVTGAYDLYLPPEVTRNRGTAFLEPTTEGTLTIPSTASKVITVGAYDEQYESYADFSGRGYASEAGVRSHPGIKPDLAAPGVNVLAPNVYGGYSYVAGTSFSTPIVSGSVALLMEWGIRQGNDPFLYGEKVKAYLRGGALPIRGESVYPNAKVGFGAVCVSESIPKE